MRKRTKIQIFSIQTSIDMNGTSHRKRFYLNGREIKVLRIFSLFHGAKKQSNKMKENLIGFLKIGWLRKCLKNLKKLYV
jgi:hypothetical protein